VVERSDTTEEAEGNSGGRWTGEQVIAENVPHPEGMAANRKESWILSAVRPLPKFRQCVRYNYYLVYNYQEIRRLPKIRPSDPRKAGHARNLLQYQCEHGIMTPTPSYTDIGRTASYESNDGHSRVDSDGDG
jgi:hypothetical protein